MPMLQALLRLYPARVRREHGDEMLEIARDGSAARAAWDLLRGLPGAHLHEAIGSPSPAPLRLTIRRHATIHAALHALLIGGFTLRLWQTLGSWPNSAFEYPCGPGILLDAWDMPLRAYRGPICAFQESANMYFHGPGTFLSLAVLVVLWTTVTLVLQLALRRIRAPRAGA